MNPTNIMGASKRLCEMIIQAFAAKIKEGKVYEVPQLFTHGMHDVITAPEIVEVLKTTKAEFVAVCFGNVLGSFMTIPEAVSLVLLAGTYAQKGRNLCYGYG